MLSAASPYFKAMFTGGLKESEMATVKLQGVSNFNFFLNIYLNKIIIHLHINTEEELVYYTFKLFTHYFLIN